MTFSFFILYTGLQNENDRAGYRYKGRNGLGSAIFQLLKVILKKVKGTSFGRAAFSYSVVQPHLWHFNFPCLLGYIRKLAFWSPWGNYFTPAFVCSHFLCPEKFTLGQFRIRTTDLSICRRTSYHHDIYLKIYLISVRIVRISIQTLKLLYVFISQIHVPSVGVHVQEPGSNKDIPCLYWYALPGR